MCPSLGVKEWENQVDFQKLTQLLHKNLTSSLFTAFVVRFLTRRFIGDYSSSLSCAYPHTLSLDNAPVSVVVWDSPAISTASVHTMCEQLDTVSEPLVTTVS